MSPVGAIFVSFPPKTGTNMLHPRSPSIVELVREQSFLYSLGNYIKPIGVEEGGQYTGKFFCQVTKSTTQLLEYSTRVCTRLNILIA